MMEIRAIGMQDIDQIRDLILQLAEDLGEDFRVDHEQCMAHYEDMLQHGDMYQNFVYCIDGVIAGFISMVMYRSLFHRKGPAIVNELVVNKEYRQHQIGTALLKHSIAIAQAHGMDEIEVGVMIENTKAIDFYRRNGLDEEYILLGKEFQGCTKVPE